MEDSKLKIEDGGWMIEYRNPLSPILEFLREEANV
jgi:hypothetical protein